jgi:hypothetical protein
VTLRSAHDLFVTAEGDGRMAANRRRADAHEAFALEQADAGSVALRTAHGTYASAARPGGVDHRAAGVAYGERFVLLA